jgi:hypothetical protein
MEIPKEKTFKEKLDKLTATDVEKFQIQQTQDLINKLEQLRLSFNG